LWKRSTYDDNHQSVSERVQLRASVNRIKTPNFPDRARGRRPVVLDLLAVKAIAEDDEDELNITLLLVQFHKILFPKLEWRSRATLDVQCLGVTQLDSTDFTRDSLRKIREFNPSNAIEKR
jgi:hypothetical protein